MKPQVLPAQITAQLLRLYENVNAAKSDWLTEHGFDMQTGEIPTGLSGHLSLSDVLEEVLYGGPADPEHLACPHCGTLHTTSMDAANVDADECNLDEYKDTKYVVLTEPTIAPVFIIYGGENQKCFGCGKELPVIAEPEWVTEGV